ncbi:hypothetical protein LLH03_04050 [bacterium]|nr:hypothetical protein [bacterium]
MDVTSEGPRESDRLPKRKLDRRWVRLMALSAMVAALACLAGLGVSVLPLGMESDALRWIGAALTLALMVVGMAWLVVQAFEAFDVDGKYDARP